MENKLVQDIDFKKRNWRRDISLIFLATSLVIGGIIPWYQEFLRITPPVMLVAIILAFIPHELMHGLFFWGCGSKVKFGATMTKFGPAVYTAFPGSTLSRNKMILITLAPQILTIGFLFIGYSLPLGVIRSLLLLVAALNLSGGVGDYYCILQMLKYDRTLQVGDSPGGLRFYMPEKEEGK